MIVNRILMQTHYQCVGKTGDSDGGSSSPYATKKVPAAQIFACSAISREHMDLFSSRQLCEDRKGFFDHLHPNRLSKSTIRIVVTQSTQVISHYFTDQLKEETTLDEKVAKGEMTRKRASQQSDEWAEREWKIRIEALPNRIVVALAKYHAITLVTRLYEYISAKFVTEVELDKLTLDTFDAGKRAARGKEGVDLFKEMFHVCWNANLLSYLADCSVHQVILLYGYYVYVQHQRKQKKQQRISDSENNSAAALEGGSLAISFLKKSTRLAVHRGICLTSASIGGGLGTVLLPGWGTLAGTNMWDGLAFGVAEDFISDAPSVS